MKMETLDLNWFRWAEEKVWINVQEQMLFFLKKRKKDIIIKGHTIAHVTFSDLC